MYLIIGLAVGAIAVMAIMRGKQSGSNVQLQSLQEQNTQLQQQLSEKTQQADTATTEAAAQGAAARELRDQLQQQQASFERQKQELKEQDNKALEQATQALREQIESQRTSFENQKQELKVQHDKALEQTTKNLQDQIENQRTNFEKQKQELKVQHEQAMQQFAQQQKEQQEQQMTLIKEQMNTASEKILRERSEQLKENNKTQLKDILDPLNKNLSDMQQAVEKSRTQQQETMVRLDETIRQNMKQVEAVGERADRLANALTGENKTQGNFGEIRLRQILEGMGLTRGEQFEEQVTLRDAQGRTLHNEDSGSAMQPDVVLHFPNKRDMVIDSKMSLKAFEDYHNAETDEERDDALKRHLASMRQHVKELAAKDYSSYISEGHSRLDFVIMYVFSESAFQLAILHDPNLWKEAYDQGVIIAGSQNLYSMLRVLDLAWRQMKQVQNQKEIMATASEVVKRVQMFYERLGKVRDQMDKTQKAFTDLSNITAPTGRGIIKAANSLVKLGAKQDAKKVQLPEVEDEGVAQIEEKGENA